MSKRTKQRKRQIENQRRKEQIALQHCNVAKVTIGDLVSRVVQKMGVTNPVNVPVVPTVPTPAIMPQGNLPVAPTLIVATPAHWPACPSSCNPMEWSRAMENHDYYLQCAEKSGKPWFQHPRHVYQYSEFVYITPEMARLLLEYNPINRKIDMIYVEGLKRDILNHHWLQTHESIAVNTLGNMHDGQHRGEAVIKAGTGWPIYTTWNVPPEAIYATDSGRKRPINEKLGFLFPDLKMNSKTAAICRAMMWGLTSRGTRYTESEIANFMFKHQEIIHWTLNNMRLYRADLQAVIAKGMLWWGEKIVGSFVERLRTVQFQGDGDPAKTLYIWMQNAQQQGRNASYASPIIYYKKVLAAIHAHAAGREAKRIYSKEYDIFEWLQGWSVPEDAPCKGEVFIYKEDKPPEDVVV